VVLSQRERYVAITLGLVLVLLVVYEAVYSPLSDWSSRISSDKKAALDQAAADDKLFADKAHLLKVWDDIQKGGLQSDPSVGQNQLRQAVTEWAVQSGVSVSAGTSGAASPVGDPKTGFVSAVVQVTCAGTTSGIAKLLYQIEVAKIPARIHSITISSKKEGVDDLLVVLNLTTLCVVKPNSAPTPANPPLSTASRTDEQ
jgi:hypothetical protein